MIYLELFLSFLQVGLFSIGGGYAAMPIIQSQVVDRYHWLDMGSFTDLITISQMTPGPIAINSATFVGIRIAGLPGALAATFGCILPSCFIVTLLAWVYYRFKGLSAVESVLSCLRPVVVSLIAAAGLTILQTAVLGGNAVALQPINWINIVLFLGAFAILRIRKSNPIWVMCGCGGAYLVIRLAANALG